MSPPKVFTFVEIACHNSIPVSYN